MISFQKLIAVRWECVHFGIVESRVATQLEKHGIAVRYLDGVGVDSGDAALEALARALAFPSYFGRNWDALDESLRDLDWLPANGYLLIVQHAEVFWHASPEAVGHLIEAWLSAAESWSRSERPFHLVLSW